MENNEVQKEKLVKKSFKYKQDQLDYIIKVKKPCKLCWLLLLLLLPLLLLIPLKKDIYVKTINAETNTEISNAEVYFQYDKQSFRKSGSPYFNFIRKTDNKGVVGFIKLRYRVYSWLFKRGTEVLTYANTSCYISDTIKRSFHSIKNKETLILKLSPTLIPLDFKVVDADDNQPLPGSKVTITAEMDGKQYLDSTQTGTDGRVSFNRIPKCGGKIKIKAEQEGYFPDSILKFNTPDLMGDINDKRLLKLKPIKKPISFFVINCKTKQPIADATVTIEFDFNGKKSVQTRKTNVNGLGKGVYNDAHIIAKIHLTAEKAYYKKGELLDWHLVKNFINYPDEKRTICLEPEENPILFKNIDSLTKKVLAGVKNIVTIKRGNQVLKPNELFSNKNGEFVVGTEVGDIISITSQYPPDYEDNSTKIKDADGMKLLKSSISERTISLKPKEVELTFRTLDEDNGSLVPDAQLTITIDGKAWQPTNSGTGIFKVTAPITSNICIIASKQDYSTNASKINPKSMRLLAKSLQADRDIPLKNKPPQPKPQPKPCTEPPQQSGGPGVDIKDFDMQNPNLKFFIDYDMASEPDQMIVYCGDKNNLGKELKNTNGKVSGTGRFEINMNDCGNSTWITIKIIGGNSGTVWNYKFTCQ